MLTSREIMFFKDAVLRNVEYHSIFSKRVNRVKTKLKQSIERLFFNYLASEEVWVLQKGLTMWNN